MAKDSSLSLLLSSIRAQLAGGIAQEQALGPLYAWSFSGRARSREGKLFNRWHSDLTRILRDVGALGAPVAKILSEVVPLLRREERLVRKLVALEGQFAFQAAISLVLPWTVALLTSQTSGMQLQWNFWFELGFFAQALGIVVFFLLLKRAVGNGKTGDSILFRWLIQVWMRAACGVNTLAAIQDSTLSLENSETEDKVLLEFSDYWLKWVAQCKQGALSAPEIPHSIRIEGSIQFSEVLFTLIRTGAPASQLLMDCIAQYDDDRYFQFEERVNRLPNQCALAFCLLLTPAAFCILLGVLWPELSAAGLGGLE